MANAPGGKPGKSVKILDDQIKENEQALLHLPEQAHKCVESSESSEDDLEVELPKFKSDQRKVNSSRKNKLKHTINKVRSKLDAEKEHCEACSKRKNFGPRKVQQRKEKGDTMRQLMKWGNYPAA